MFLAERGYNRSVVQCRDKIKKLRTQYHRVLSLSKSGSSAEEKENFLWYEAVDGILGTKPTTRPKLLESTRRLQLISAEQSTETDTSLGEERAVTLLEMPEPAATSTPGPRQATSRPKAADMSGKRVQEPAFEAFMETQRMLADFLQAEERRHVEFMQMEVRFRQEDSSRTDMRLERMMQHQTNLIQMLLATQNATPHPVNHFQRGGAPGRQFHNL
uniref:Myb/SANT-like DNA-binding domain-containing protein n=1 Tax=Knipowitschia caucasica TaxID=637954 RepID=A0AAV2KSL7_KNICA